MAKNIKGRKFVATAASAALVASAIVPVASAAEFGDQSKISSWAADAVAHAVEKGYMQGTGGNFNPQGTVTKAQVAQVVYNALGLKPGAESKFSDVPAGAWYADAVNALAAAGFVTGTDNGTFEPEKNVTLAEAAVILVNALGLKGEADLSVFADASSVPGWANAAIQALVANGYIKGGTVNGKLVLDPLGNLSRERLATFFVAVAIDTIEGGGEVTPEPTPEVPVGELAVDSVSASNLRQAVVTFNNEIDANAAGTYTFAAGSGLTVAATTVVGKNVVLTLTGSATQSLTTDLTIENAKDVNGKTVAKTVKSVKFTDVTSPVVSDVEVTGPRTLVVKFSEPLRSTSSFTVDNGLIAIANTTWSADNTVATITLGTAPAEGSHVVKVEGGADYAGFVVEKVEKTFTYAKDVTPPSFTVKSANETKVVLEFTEAIENIGDSNVNFYHTNPGTPAYIATKSLAADGKTLTLTFAAPLAAGNATIYLAYTSNTGVKIQDKWGNKTEATSVTANVVVDNVAPTVTKVEANAAVNAILVTFSEAVSGATNSANYVVRDAADNSIVPFTNVTQVGSSNTYSINFPSQLNGGSYKVEIKNIKDTSFRENKLADFSTVLAVEDKVAPRVNTTAKLVSGKKVKVSFNEAMKVDTIVNPANYLFAGSALDAKVKISAVDGNKAVILDFTDVTPAPSLAGAIIDVGRVADNAGNLVGSLSTRVTVETTIAAPAFKSAAVTGKNSIILNFDEVITSLSATDFQVNITDPTDVDHGTKWINAAAVTGVQIEDGKTVVTIATTQNLPTTASNVRIRTNPTASDITGKNEFGASLSIASTTVGDKYAPTFDSVVAYEKDGDNFVDEFVLTFSENLYVASVQESDFSIEGYEIKGISTSGNTVTVQVKEKTANDLSATPKVKLVGSVEDTLRNATTAQTELTAANAVSRVKAVEDLITALTVTLTGTDSALYNTEKGKVEAARSAYNDLSSSLKASVTNYSTLTGKEADLLTQGKKYVSGLPATVALTVATAGATPAPSTYVVQKVDGTWGDVTVTWGPESAGSSTGTLSSTEVTDFPATITATVTVTP